MAKDTQVEEYPTVSYGSLVTALDKFNEAGGAPSEFHPSAFDKKTFNGSTIALLVKAFRALGLSNEKDEPVVERVTLLIEPKTRKESFNALLNEKYAGLIALPLAKASPNRFNEWFDLSGMHSEAVRKAKTFFLHAARANGVEVSSFILNQNKTRTPSSRKSRKRAVEPKDPAPGNGGGGNGGETTPPPPDDSIANKILAKYPDFDPTWTSDVQAKWFEGIAKLQDALKE